MNADFIDLTGRQFGKLIVISREENDKWGAANWKCICNCIDKNIKIATSKNLRTGRTQSCGCILRNRIKSKHPQWGGCGEIGGHYFSQLKRRSAGEEFSITLEYIWDLFLKQNRKCRFSGIELRFSTKSTVSDGTASLDRIDSSKGYVIDNVQWVHKDINYMKQDHTDKDFIEWCRLIVNHDNKEKWLDR